MLHNINCHFYAFWSHLRTYGAIKLPITTTPITVRTVPVAMFPNVTVPVCRIPDKSIIHAPTSSMAANE